jgi:hypothetical protein
MNNAGMDKNKRKKQNNSMIKAYSSGQANITGSV